MSAAMILTVIFGGIVLAIGIICGTILMAMRMRHGGGFSKDRRQQQADEGRMIQEIYHGLSRLEARVDALETILTDRQRKDTAT